MAGSRESNSESEGEGTKGKKREYEETASDDVDSAGEDESDDSSPVEDTTAIKTTRPPVRKTGPLEDFIPLSAEAEVDSRPRADLRLSEDDARRMRRDERRKLVPWARKRYDPNPAIALHQEILDLVSYLQPTREEFAMRLDLIDRLESVVQSVWPQATVKVFGSFSTKLYTASSDIDLVVFGDWKRPPLHTLANALTKAGLPEKIDVISKAKVPIIKLTDAKTQIDIDISFNIPNGPSAAKLVTQFIDDYPCLFPLALVLKQFLSQRRLNEPFNGGVGSYSLIAMIVSFLQLHPRIKDQARTTSLNLGVLLVEFMELYGRHFNYTNNAISLLDGGSYFCKERHFEFPHDPQKRRPGNFDKLTVQDPQDPENDAGRSTFNIRTVRAAFSHAYAVLASGLADPRNFVGATALSSIIHIDESTVKWRESVQSEWGEAARAMSDRIEPLQWFSRWQDESGPANGDPPSADEEDVRDKGSAKSKHTRFESIAPMAPAPRINNKKSKKKDKKEKKAKKSKKSDRDLEDGELSRPATPLDNRAQQPMGYDGMPLPAPINPYLPTHLQHQLNQPMPYHHSPPGPHPAYPGGHAPPRPPTSLPAPRPPMDARRANYPPMSARPMGPRPPGPPMPDLRAYLAAPARPLPGYAGMQSAPPQQAYHGKGTTKNKRSKSETGDKRARKRRKQG